MKKIFTLFAAVLMAGSMMAKDVTFYGYSSAWARSGSTLAQTIDGVTVTISWPSTLEYDPLTYICFNGYPSFGDLSISATSDDSAITGASINGSEQTGEGPWTVHVDKDQTVSIISITIHLEDEPEPVKLCTLDFPSHNDAEIGDYTSTWTATVDGATWTLTNFNNNRNVWNLVKCGRRGVASVASIETPALKATVNTLIYDFAALPANSVDSAFIYALYQGEEQGKAPVTLKAGKDTIATPVTGVKYSYKLEIYCKSASSNGPVQLSSVQVYGTPVQSAVEDPVFDPAADDFYDAQTVAITCATEGAEIHYTLDGTEPTAASALYTEALTISETTTVKAIAVVGADQSDVVEKTYTIAPVYASLTELVNAGAPAGQKVVVTLTNETIDSLYVSSGNKTNGVYLTAGGRMVEIYCYNVPAEWAVGGTISGTVKGEWKEWNGTWEVCPSSWEGISYTAPDPTAIEAVATERKAVKLIENGQVVIIRDGKKFNLVGTKL